MISPRAAGTDPHLALSGEGYAFLSHSHMRELLDAAGGLRDWPAFAASWNDLAPDTYLARFGRYRRRRHAVFRIERGGAIARQAHQPHYQSLVYNPLQGGIERWFEPILPDIGAGETLNTVLHFCAQTFGALAPATAVWRAEAHQFRIEARPGEPGQPTPEGVHSDGVDYVLVLMVDRVNIACGTTTIHATAASEALGSFTLTQPFDAALVDDTRVFHGVTPVETIDPSRPAYRDVFVVTMKKDEG